MSLQSQLHPGMMQFVTCEVVQVVFVRIGFFTSKIIEVTDFSDSYKYALINSIFIKFIGEQSRERWPCDSRQLCVCENHIRDKGVRMAKVDTVLFYRH